MVLLEEKIYAIEKKFTIDIRNEFSTEEKCLDYDIRSNWAEQFYDFSYKKNKPSFYKNDFTPKLFRPVSEFTEITNSNVDNFELEKTFDNLVEQWRTETKGMSSTNQMSMHPVYQQIIGMGKDVIPLLLREVERRSGRWFWALKSITREDPVPSEKRGRTKEMRKAWLEWGKSQGYRW